MQECTKCGRSYDDNAKFCPGCGAPVESGSTPDFCTQCGAKLTADSRFCPSCGATVAGSSDVNAGLPMQVGEYTGPADAIVLTSSAPIPSKIGWAKWGYIGSILLCFVAGVFGLIAFGLVFIAEHAIMSGHRGNLRGMKFKFLNGVTPDAIYNRIQPSLSQKYGDKLTFDREGDTISVKYDSNIYDININDDSTFSI